MYVVVVLVIATSDLATSHVCPETICIFVVDGKVIKNIATFIWYLSTSCGHCLDWRFILHTPGNFVHTVNGLLNKAIAT